MKFEHWYLVLGALLITIALVSSFLKRLPLTTTMIYLGAGMLMGPLGFEVVHIDPVFGSGFLERFAEMAVIVSLFTAGLKLRSPLTWKNWAVPVQLAFVSMALTVALVAAVGVYLLGLPLGAAVLLGAVLAPTDPVLASDVQLESPRDRDTLRFSLTGEAGFNDGTAFPFVMLGLGLMGLHEIGDWAWRWWTVDVLWAVCGGLAIGAVLGGALGKLVTYLREQHREGVGRDEFLALGLIMLSYSAAVLFKAYGFLAVFAAGVTLGVVERRYKGTTAPDAVRKAGEKPGDTTAPMTGAVLIFNEQLEKVIEVALVLFVGAMLTFEVLQVRHIWFVPVLLLFIRPVAVYIGLLGTKTEKNHLAIISWFGIRGIGSIYYLMYAVSKGLPEELARDLISITFWCIAASVIVHGISVTPLMAWYESSNRTRR